ncbi:MAG: glycosyltransferase [Candidatus Omnitrophica bacterium]|nr:glycosyltransferase [Candidatus Omnitrophota bacterium]
MTVSIIIVAKTWAKNLEECIERCQGLSFADFEILVLPETDKGTVPNQRIKIIPTGPLSPARKRDIALNYAQGEILAFLDDDAYPESNWLTNALEDFKDNDVAAVCGPAITPGDDGLRQKVSSMIFASFLVCGPFTYRYLPKAKREVWDYPSCNLLVRKTILEELGGFNTDFWPGEDTKLCLDITKKLGKRIIYDPRVLVYHHRRKIFLPHLKQIASYALHRGYFVKRYPETSLKFTYFIPTLFFLAIVGGAMLSLFSASFKILYLSGIIFYLFLVFIFSIRKTVYLIPLLFLGIILTHLTYGFYFLKGLVSLRLKEEK